MNDTNERRHHRRHPPTNESTPLINNNRNRNALVNTASRPFILGGSETSDDDGNSLSDNSAFFSIGARSSREVDSLTVDTLDAPSVDFPSSDDDESDEDDTYASWYAGGVDGRKRADDDEEHRRRRRITRQGSFYNSRYSRNCRYCHCDSDRGRHDHCGSRIMFFLVAAVIVYSSTLVSVTVDEPTPEKKRKHRHHHSHHSLGDRGANGTDSYGESHPPPPEPEASIKFSELAAVMLPPWFSFSVKLVETILTDRGGEYSASVGSGFLGNNNHGDNNDTSTNATALNGANASVVVLRKTIRQTRDLLDIFAPVYPGSVTYLHELLRIERTNVYNDDKEDNIWSSPGDVRVDYDVLMEQARTTTTANTRNLATQFNNTIGVISRKGDGGHANVGSTDSNGDDVNGSDGEERDVDSADSNLAIHFRHIQLHERDDAWRVLRNVLSEGYVIARNMHNWSTSGQLLVHQKNMLDWKARFLDFTERYDVLGYLSDPCPDGDTSSGSGSRKAGGRDEEKAAAVHCSHLHVKSSHFWKTVPTSRMPDGFHSASAAVRVLGIMQLRRSFFYLEALQPHANVLEEGVRVTYQNLRKDLRSFLNEVDLFGHLLLPDILVSSQLNDDNYGTFSEKSTTVETKGGSDTNREATIQEASEEIEPRYKQTEVAIATLKQTRKMLGVLHNDCTAYITVVKLDTNPEEQFRLRNVLDDRWKEFRAWEHEVDLHGKFEYLIEKMGGVAV